MFGWFSKKTDSATVQKHAARMANKRAQAADRWESIQVLSGVIKPASEKLAAGTLTAEERALAGEAVAALLPRFTYYNDPSITDKEEKDEAFRWVVSAGELAVAPVVKHMRDAESLSWSIKVLDRVAPPERVIEVLIEVLGTMDVEYERDPQRKLQVLQVLEERRHPGIAPAAARFLDDVNETARFHAVGVVLGQENRADVLPELQSAVAKDESVRVRTKIIDAMVQHQWPLTTGDTTQAARLLPIGYAMGEGGVPRKR